MQNKICKRDQGLIENLHKLLIEAHIYGSTENYIWKHGGWKFQNKFQKTEKNYYQFFLWS